MSFKDTPKANWLRPVTFANGTQVAISDKSGIIKVTVPGAGNRGAMFYRDELQALFSCMIELQRYAEENQDVALSKDNSKDLRKMQQVQQRNEAKLAEVLTSVNPERLTAILEAIAKSKAG